MSNPNPYTRQDFDSEAADRGIPAGLVGPLWNYIDGDRISAGTLLNAFGQIENSRRFSVPQTWSKPGYLGKIG